MTYTWVNKNYYCLLVFGSVVEQLVNVCKPGHWVYCCWLYSDHLYWVYWCWLYCCYLYWVYCCWLYCCYLYIQTKYR